MIFSIVVYHTFNAHFKCLIILIKQICYFLFRRCTPQIARRWPLFLLQWWPCTGRFLCLKRHVSIHYSWKVIWKEKKWFANKWLTSNVNVDFISILNIQLSSVWCHVLWLKNSSNMFTWRVNIFRLELQYPKSQHGRFKMVAVWIRKFLGHKPSETEYPSMQPINLVTTH